MGAAAEGAGAIDAMPLLDAPDLKVISCSATDWPAELDGGPGGSDAVGALARCIDRLAGSLAVMKTPKGKLLKNRLQTTLQQAKAVTGVYNIRCQPEDGRLDKRVGRHCASYIMYRIVGS